MATLEGFFEGHPKANRLFQIIKGRIETLGPVTMKVSKTQISFSAGRGFAWVWLPQMWVKAPEDSVTLAIALPHRVEHPRIKDASEPYPGRWTNHIIIEKETDINEDVERWLAEAYVFGKSLARSRSG